MSTVTPPVRGYSRVLLRLASVRAVEVCVLQASPLLGAWLGGLDPDAGGLGRLALLLVASTALTAHVFVLNDWAGYDADAHDARRASLGGGDISRDQIARVAIALLIVAAVGFVAIGGPPLACAAGIAALGLVYSLAPRFGKSTPVAASLNHLVGGSLHFLMGYTLVHAVDAKGVALSVFFGLVFAAGHLNQEVRDFEADRANGIRTSAVVFGCRRSFLASFCLFTAAYVLVAGLAAAGTLPRLLLVTVVVWLAQAWWSAQAMRRGLQVETALWMQRRYRWLFAFVGLLMVLR
jgi:4-hydroxybenzoate polyprenyltransferase